MKRTLPRRARARRGRVPVRWRSERLCGLDECFLGFETPNSPMHVAVTAIFEQGPLCRPGGGVDLDGVREHLAGRLRLVPRFRQRLVYLPVMRDAVWVDDESFDLSRPSDKEPPATRIDGEAPAALRRDHRAAARPPASALGGVGGGRTRERRLAFVARCTPQRRPPDRRPARAGGHIDLRGAGYLRFYAEPSRRRTTAARACRVRARRRTAHADARAQTTGDRLRTGSRRCSGRP